LLSALVFLAICSRTSAGKSARLSRARARSSVKAGSTAVRSRSASATVAGLAVAGGAAASSEVLPSDMSPSAAEAATESDPVIAALKRCATPKQIRTSRAAGDGPGPVATFALLWPARLRPGRLDPDAHRRRESSPAVGCRKRHAQLQTNQI